MIHLIDSRLHHAVLDAFEATFGKRPKDQQIQIQTTRPGTDSIPGLNAAAVYYLELLAVGAPGFFENHPRQFVPAGDELRGSGSGR